MKRLTASLGTILIVAGALPMRAVAQISDAAYFSDLRWRLIGPHRAGRVWWVTGVSGDPATCYAGTPAGALWKSTNGGTTWASISDRLLTTGIVALAAAGAGGNFGTMAALNAVLASGGTSAIPAPAAISGPACGPGFPIGATMEQGR